MSNFERCQCGCCGGPGKWKEITEKVNECGYCREWQVVDKAIPEKKETRTMLSSDGKTETHEVTINSVGRSATLKECVEASMEKNKDNRDKTNYNQLICEDIFYHSKEGSKLIKEIYLAQHELDKTKSKTKTAPSKQMGN